MKKIKSSPASSSGSSSLIKRHTLLLQGTSHFATVAMQLVAREHAENLKRLQPRKPSVNAKQRS